MDQLKVLRALINEIDLRILDLISARGSFVQQMEEITSFRGLPPLNPKWERRILDELTQANQGPYPDDAVRAIFRVIIERSRSLQAYEVEPRDEALQCPCRGLLSINEVSYP